MNERITQLESLAQKAHEHPIKDAPDIVQCDGMWLTIQGQSEQVKPAKGKRARNVRKGERVVIFVALGFWQKGEKRAIVDWQSAKSEAHTEWERLLKRLYEPGVTPENGLQAVIGDGGGGVQPALDLVYGSAVIDQRCIFPK